MDICRNDVMHSMHNPVDWVISPGKFMEENVLLPLVLYSHNVWKYEMGFTLARIIEAPDAACMCTESANQ